MVFCDANVLLELVLSGRAKRSSVQRYLMQLDDETAISLLTAHLIMHFGRKDRLPDKQLDTVITANTLLALTSDDYLWATQHEAGRDFEDALQVACAVRNRADTFVTFDRALVQAYRHVAPCDFVLLD